MRKSRSDALLFVGIASWLTIACTSGIGTPANNFDDPYESAPNSRESPGAGRESPGAGREAPPASTENPGSQGGGPGSTPAGSGNTNACPPCDQKFSCITVTNGKTDDDNVELKTKNGACTLDGVLVFECGGKLTLQGKPIGTWQASGAGFTATATSSEGASTITCVPRATSTPPPPPPTTATVSPPAPPPPVVDAGIRDSGTKG